MATAPEEQPPSAEQPSVDEDFNPFSDDGKFHIKSGARAPY